MRTSPWLPLALLKHFMCLIQRSLPCCINNANKNMPQSGHKYNRFLATSWRFSGWELEEGVKKIGEDGTCPCWLAPATVSLDCPFTARTMPCSLPSHRSQLPQQQPGKCLQRKPALQLHWQVTQRSFRLYPEPKVPRNTQLVSREPSSRESLLAPALYI